MLKLTLSLCLAFFVTTNTIAQDHWKSLLSNDRGKALEQIEKQYKSNKSIENIVARELIWRENGNIHQTKNFIEEFSSAEGFSNYLYALWNEEFLFGDYIESGFNKRKRENIEALYPLKYSDITLASGVNYIKGVVDRNYNDFESYRRNSLKIDAIRDWQFCGVFENLNGSGLDVVYDPENHPENDIVFQANSNGLVNWYTPKYNDYEAYPFFEGHAEYGTGVHYAQTFVKNPEDQKVVLRLGASDKLKVWLNDVVVFETTKSARTDLDAYLVELDLPKGTNRLLVKLSGESTSNYFMARFTDLNGKIVSNLSYDKDFSAYNFSDVKALNPKRIRTNFETYFEQKSKNEPDNFLYTYCLIRTYLRNQNHEAAKEVLTPLLEENPNSSILRTLMIRISLMEGNSDYSNEMKENLKKDDGNYHLSMTYQFTDVQELFRLSAVEMESFLDTYAELIDDELITYSCKLIINLRKENKNEVKRYLDKLIQVATENEQLVSLKVFAPIYSSMFKDTKTHLKILESLNKKYFDMEIRNQLSDYYASVDKFSKSFAILQENYKWLDHDFESTNSIVDYLQSYERYDESQPYLDELFEIFPYSFLAMKSKGDALLQANKTEEAIAFYNRYLIYNSSNLSLRRKVEDISNHEDIIESYVEKDIYEFIKDSKGLITENNYGFNILKDDAIIELFPEAGGRGRYTVVYEITSEKGIERLKEYDLGLYSNYNIIKSEIVKENGSLIPADASGSSFVFTNLSVGDVILIDYQSGFGGSGRFYKDYVNYFTFDGFHPVKESRYILIAPKDKKINYEVTHQAVEFSSEAIGDRMLYKWVLEDHPGCAKSESYMPELVDFASVLHVSTIKDWNEIANWYSDLVRSQMIVDADVKKAFNSIFKDVDPLTLSESDRAERIYKYLMNNFSYSSVNFRQSGFIPQKPGKTLTTKLGDCKDFSTVYATFADMAGLDANLVLVLTADNGRDDIILPSQDFNHCIVRVMIDGKEQFLELTDKDLPFKALPNSVRAGTVLVIPKNPSPNEKFDLRHLDQANRIENHVIKKVKMYVTNEHQNFEITTQYKGYNRSYWTSVFDNSNYDTYQSRVNDFLQDRINSNAKTDTVIPVSVARGSDEFVYTAKVSLDEKLNKIGSFNVLKIPYIHNEYSGDVISEDSRKHEINYHKYEQSDLYSIDYDVYLEEGEFSEIPESKLFQFKGHSYSRSYEKISPKHLRILVKATMTIEDVSTEDYAEFKNYVKNVLESKDEFIGFK